MAGAALANIEAHLTQATDSLCYSCTYPADAAYDAWSLEDREDFEDHRKLVRRALRTMAQGCEQSTVSRLMERWQQLGYDSYGAWRRATEKARQQNTSWMWGRDPNKCIIHSQSQQL